MRRAGLAVTIAAVVVAIAGCGHEEAMGQDRHNFGEPGLVRSVVPGVTFYPACGNEVLVIDGVSWYQYDPSNIDDFPDPQQSIQTWIGSGGGVGMPATALTVVPRVVPPSPGDDVGILVVYGGNIAYWQSDSDVLATWLTAHPITYNWVC